MSEQRIRMFSNGSQFDDWEAANCDRCTKGHTVDEHGMDQFSQCEINQALNFAYWDDGTVRAEIARRAGYFDHNTPGKSYRYCWPCNEVEWTEAWKAECLRRREEAVQHG